VALGRLSRGACRGVYPEPSKFADNWRLERRFKPAMSAATRERKLAGWARAVKGLLASDQGRGRSFCVVTRESGVIQYFQSAVIESEAAAYRILRFRGVCEQQ